MTRTRAPFCSGTNVLCSRIDDFYSERIAATLTCPAKYSVSVCRAVTAHSHLFNFIDLLRCKRIRSSRLPRRMAWVRCEGRCVALRNMHFAMRHKTVGSRENNSFGAFPPQTPNPHSRRGRRAHERSHVFQPRCARARTVLLPEKPPHKRLEFTVSIWTILVLFSARAHTRRESLRFWFLSAAVPRPVV